MTAATAVAVPRLDLDPRFSTDPVNLLCELVDQHGIDDALDMWIRATTRLDRAKTRLTHELLFIVQQQGPR